MQHPIYHVVCVCDIVENTCKMFHSPILENFDSKVNIQLKIVGSISLKIFLISLFLKSCFRNKIAYPYTFNTIFHLFLVNFFSFVLFVSSFAKYCFSMEFEIYEIFHKDIWINWGGFTKYSFSIKHRIMRFALIQTESSLIYLKLCTSNIVNLIEYSLWNIMFKILWHNIHMEFYSLYNVFQLFAIIR